jgi:hypothetical protein
MRSMVVGAKSLVAFSHRSRIALPPPTALARAHLPHCVGEDDGVV